MKTTLLLPLLLGLLVTGCTRSNSSTKTASTSSNQADTARKTVLTHPSTEESLALATTATTTTSPASVNVPISDFNMAPSVSVNLTPLTPLPENVPALNEKVATTTDTVSPMTSDSSDIAAPTAAPTLAARITEWKLTPQDIGAAVLQSDRIERSKTTEAGAPTGAIDTGMISDLIAGKFQGDSVIAPRKFNIMVVGDTVTLTGTAQNFDQIGRAMALALDTDGISKVVSRIKPDPTAP